MKKNILRNKTPKVAKYEENSDCSPPEGIIPPCPPGYQAYSECTTCGYKICESGWGLSCTKYKDIVSYNCAEICKKVKK